MSKLSQALLFKTYFIKKNQNTGKSVAALFSQKIQQKIPDFSAYNLSSQISDSVLI